VDKGGGGHFGWGGVSGFDGKTQGAALIKIGEKVLRRDKCQGGGVGVNIKKMRIKGKEKRDQDYPRLEIQSKSQRKIKRRT